MTDKITIIVGRLGDLIVLQSPGTPNLPPNYLTFNADEALCLVGHIARLARDILEESGKDSNQTPDPLYVCDRCERVCAQVLGEAREAFKNFDVALNRSMVDFFDWPEKEYVALAASLKEGKDNDN